MQKKYYKSSISSTVFTMLVIFFSKCCAQNIDKKDNKFLDMSTNYTYDIIVEDFSFEGSNKLSEQYIVTSAIAKKINDYTYNLNNVSAIYKSSYGDIIIKAQNGLINNQAMNIELLGKVNLQYKNIECKTNNLSFDLNNKNISSNTRTNLHFLDSQSEISSDNLLIPPNSNIVELNGKVRGEINVNQ